MPRIPPFASRVVRWQADHGRHDLPWQGTRDPYRIWLSEIMLQQTQVSTVLGYYERFLARFPDAGSLAAAHEDEVFALWSGLGYYARARNLHRAAREVAQRFGGRFPADFDSLASLPGVGRSTASAIAAFASGERRAILDSNARRVLARHAGIGGDPTSAAVLASLWSAAEARLPGRDIEAYTQGMMDLGARLCAARRPQCPSCPVAADCVARLEGRIDELPGKRPRRVAPRRQLSMLVVVSRGEVLLEKRPSKGIWGGLWSLPEALPGAPPSEALARDWGLAASKVEALPPFEHAFTHFTLEVTPWRVWLARGAKLAGSRASTWMPLAEVAGAALPAPVKRLLVSLSASRS
jgi:A/G-specific adenine glycosylase